MVTLVPPAVKPAFGETLVTAGSELGATKVNWSAVLVLLV
jgi:hypothetical protein